MAVLFPAPLGAQGCDPTNPATFVAGITVIKGQVRLEREGKGEFSRVRIDHPERLVPCLPDRKLDTAMVRQMLASDLDSALANRKPFYWYDPSQSDAEKTKLKPPEMWTRPKLGWADYFAAYTASVGEMRAVRTWSWFRSNLNSDIGALALPKQNVKTDLKNAEITFNVVAPGVPWQEMLPAAEALPRGLRVQRQLLAEYLKHSDSGLWRKEQIQALLVDFFARRGWSPMVLVTPADAPPPRITIAASLSIVQVTFAPPVSKNLREPVLYLLFPGNRYHLVRVRPVCEHQGLKYAAIDLSRQPGVCAGDKGYVPPEPFPETPFNQLAFMAEQPLVASLGFTVTPLIGESGVNLQVERNAPKQAATPKTNQPIAAAGSPGPSTGTASREAAQGATLPAAMSSGATARPAVDRVCPEQEAAGDQPCGNTIPPKDKKGYVGAGFSYNPGQGFRPLIATEYQRLTGPGSFSLKTGSANELVFLSGAASFDFAGFSSLQHRLTLNFKGGTEVNNNRLIRTQIFDERRNGGTARLDFELHRNDLGQSVTLYAEGGEQIVELTSHKPSSGLQTVLNDTLVSGAMGAVYTISGDSREIPFRVQLEPGIQMGDGQNGRFYKLTASALYHQDFLGPYVFQLQAHYAGASRNTPVYELPAFGGPNSLRGFRTDDVLGRRFWSAQPEFWFPVPFTTAGESKVSTFLSRNVRLAGMFDVGGVYQILGNAPSGIKAGPGAGVRVNFQGATISLDWGYGLGRVESGRGHGRIYFSVSRALF